ncbi:cytochrome b5 domain-containing protein [Acrasis kona]
MAKYCCQRYYTSKEVADHNTTSDCWVTLLGQVYDLNDLIKQNYGSHLLEPIIKVAGEDISHWFDDNTKDVKTRIDPVLHTRSYYLPMGKFIHASALEESSKQVPWWRDQKYIIGKLSRKTRTIRIINTLTHQDHLLEVCSEETLNEILDRYLRFNSHAASYTWKRMGRKLDMTMTLDENGIPDEDSEFADLAIRDTYYTPALHLYFNDDLTVG